MKKLRLLASFIGASLMHLSVIASEMEYEVEFKQSQIQEQIDSLMPVSKQSMMAEIEVKAVQLTLLDKNDRVALNAELNVKTVGSFETEAKLGMESGLRYEPTSGSFFLQDVKVLNVHAEQIPQSIQPQVASLAEQVLNQVLEGYPIYTLDSSEVNQHLLKSSLTAIKVRDQKLIAVLKL